MKEPVVLRLYQNGELKDVKQFTDGQIVIGQSDDAQFVVDDPKVSPLHCVIENREGTFYITDLGSVSGTFIDGQKVLEQKIETGAEITVGEFVVQFNIGVPQPLKGTGTAVAAAVAKPAKEPEPKPVVEAAPEPKAEPAPEPEAPAPEVASTPPPLDETPAPSIDFTPPTSKGTYAPKSEFKSADDIIKPSKGSSIEVVVTWKERVLSTHHYNEKGSVTIGSDDSSDIVVPLLGTSLAKHKILNIDAAATIFLTGQMHGEYIDASGASSVVSGSVNLAQGDMLKVSLLEGTVVIYVRYTPEAPKPIMAPLLDLTASEVTGVILSIVVAAIFGLYMLVYSPLPDDEEKIEEPFRKAIVTFNPPKPKKIVRVGEKSQKTVEKVKSTKQGAPSTQKAGKPGKAANLVPKETKKTTKRVSSAKRQGGAIKTGAAGASAKSEKRDPKKLGLLSVFGTRGAQKKLDKVYSGAGELTGIAGAATGKAGSKDDRAGSGIGARLKETDAGGSGRSTVGISGVGTKGRGSGTFGYGTGGIGKKVSSEINVGGAEEAFVGSIDREAIRRVIIGNLRQIRSCYERELNKDPNLFGKLVIEWDIVEKGRATNARIVTNTMNNNAVANCLKNRLLSWRFPEPPDDQIARVTYPFVFAAK